MKKVKFVRSLNIENVEYYKHDEIRCTNMTPVMGDYGYGYLDTGAQVTDRVVPITKFTRYKRDPRTQEVFSQDTYIAWSPEVEELLDLPFRSLNEQIDTLKTKTWKLEDELRGYKEANRELKSCLDKSATFWQRVKYLFARKL